MIKRYPSLGSRRSARTRLRIRQRSDRPRLSVFRSHKYLYAQIIDDRQGQTLAAAKGKSAKIVGQEIAHKARSCGVSAVVFDRGRYRFLGRVKLLAEAAREAGLQL